MASCNGVAWTCSVITLLVLGAISVLIAWGVSNPKDPHFFIDSAAVSGYNLTADNNLTAAFAVRVSAYNPNPHYFIYYDVVMVSVYNNGNGILLAYEVLPDPFSHDPKGRVSMDAGPTASDVALTLDVGTGNTTEALAALRAAGNGGGTAELEVRVRAVTRFKYKGWKKFHHMMKAVCSPFAVKFNGTSEASGAQQTRCDVYTY